MSHTPPAPSIPVAHSTHSALLTLSYPVSRVLNPLTCGTLALLCALLMQHFLEGSLWSGCPTSHQFYRLSKEEEVVHIMFLRELFYESPSITVAAISNGMGNCNSISGFDGLRSSTLPGQMVPPTLSGARQKYCVEANDIKW